MTSPIAVRYYRRLEAQTLALELLARHSLGDWRFAFNRRKQGMGLCRFTSRTIELSLHLVDRNELDEIRDTILHEIAHALAGPGHGHDAIWKQKCVEIGARPQRCGHADMPRGRWHARCSGCGTIFTRHRQPKRVQGVQGVQGWFCPPCGPEIGNLVWRAGSGPHGNETRSPELPASDGW